MGKKKDSHPYQQLIEGPVFERCVDPTTGGVRLQHRGYCRAINGRPYGSLAADWLSRIESHARTPISHDLRKVLELVLTNYIRDRAGELAAIPWRDKDRGLFDGLEAIDRAARALLAAADKAGPATGYIWQRLEQIEDPHFSREEQPKFFRDEFYPQLTQLIRRTHLLLPELMAEKKRGDALQIGNAWGNFVYGIANLYQDMGGEIKVTKLSSANRDTQQPSAFTGFAHAAMLEVPRDLREHAPGGETSVETFSDALSDEISAQKKQGVLRARRRDKSP
ncbi:MAG: hypothetical protein HYS06_02060 [Methylocystis sp.]|nr:hypothetical protein [Methylocystis sp.]